MKNKPNFQYSNKTSTSICYEKPSKQNPFVAESMYLFGYDSLELVKKKSFVEVLFLLLTGELPNHSQTQLLNALMVGFINPGPRDPSVRAAMIAGVSKTNTPHLLPIGLMVLGGEQGGASEVEKAMSFIESNIEKLPHEFVISLELDNNANFPPGLGTSFGSKHIIAEKLATHIIESNCAGNAIKWYQALIDNHKSKKIGWLTTGLAAAAFLDLGIGAREGVSLFQLLCAPGIMVHALEQTHKPVTSMPFLEDKKYEYKP